MFFYTLFKVFHLFYFLYNNTSKSNIHLKKFIMNSISNKEKKRSIKKLKKNPLFMLQEFDYIGPVTMYHLAKNIGLPVAKPDRHLVRIAKMENYQDVQTFCQDVSKLSGDSIPVVDLVYWRYATIERNYLKVLSSMNCSNTNRQNLNDTLYNPFNSDYESSVYL